MQTRSGVSVCLGACLCLAISASGARAGAPPLDRELKFATGLLRLGFPDFAERIVDRIEERFPEARPRAAVARIEILTARGRFEEARALIAAMPPDDTATTAMRLALADAYHAWNRIGEARAI